MKVSPLQVQHARKTAHDVSPISTQKAFTVTCAGRECTEKDGTAYLVTSWATL